MQIHLVKRLVDRKLLLRLGGRVAAAGGTNIYWSSSVATKNKRKLFSIYQLLQVGFPGDCFLSPLYTNSIKSVLGLYLRGISFFSSKCKLAAL